MNFLLISVLGYLIGSVPFALVIGKLFYKTDIRRHGSGNLGGGNTGRVLGAKAGVAVMTLDILKVTLAVFLAKGLAGTDGAMALGALSAAAGHCWPVFARFRGGKAVAVTYGYLFSLWVAAGRGPLFFLLPLGLYLVILKLTKTVSLASVLSTAAVTAYSFAVLGPGPESLTLLALALLVLVRHRGNLRRVAQGTENKISWM